MKKIISILLCISMLLGMAAFVTAAEENTTISVNISSVATANSWTNGTKYETLVMDDNITVTASGSKDTGKYYTKGNEWRTYQSDNGSITVTAANDATIVSVKFTYTTKNGGTLKFNNSNYSSNTTITVNNSSATFVVANTGSANNGQVKITAIEVVYSTVSAGPHEHNTNTPYYDENGHWKSCNCDDPEAPKTDVVPHELSKKFDTNGHWDVCAGCDYTTASVEHTFENGVCVCGAHDPNAYLENPIVGKPLKLGVYNPNNKAFNFANGKIANSYYLGTTTNITESADLIITDTDGGYHLSLKSGEETFYINIAAVWNASKNKYSYNMKLEDTATTVFTWNETYHTFQTLFGEDAYYIGTYNTYNTISASNLEYITTSFPAHIYCNHSWNNATCTAPKTCSVCGATAGEANGHTRPDPAKVCINQTCACGANIPADKDHVTEVIPAVDATCTATGLTEGKKCTVCGTVTVKQEEVPMLDHVPGDAATCTSDQTCKNCPYVFVEGGHKYNDKLTCTVCGDVTNHTHETEVRGAIDATCTKEGYTGDTYCKICDVLQKKGSVIPVKAHTEVVDAGKAPTCTATGLTEGKHCSVCNTVTVKQEVIAAKGHTEVIDAAKAPTCTATGLTEGKHCSVCNEVIVAQQVVPAKNHTPGDPATCTTAQTCTSCQAVLVAATGHSFTNGKCTVCQAADPDYVAPTEPETTEPETTEPAGDGNTTSSNVLGDNGWENGKVKDSFSIGSNVTVSVSATPVGEWGQNSGKFYDSDKTWRIYQNESPAITVAAGTGKIVSVKVTYETKNDGILTLNGKNIESGAVVEVDAASVVFGVANTGDKTNGQVKITAIEVIHTGPASSTPEDTKPEETKPEETKPEETKPEETKPEETKPEETKPEATDPAPENPEFSIVTKPSASEPFKFGMTQKNLENAVYYLKGGMDGYYMATTTDINEAIDVYLEETEGGFYLYTMVDGTKTYINMVVSGTHVNGAYEAAASTVYTLKNGTLVATVEVEGEAAEYWFGTRNDKQYTTMGPCKTSYEGFYGQFYGTSNPETADTFSSIVFALMALSAIGAGVVISKKKEF